MEELETYKQLYLLQKEEITSLKRVLAARKDQVESLQALIINQDKIIELQKSIVDEFVPRISVPHLRLVKDE